MKSIKEKADYLYQGYGNNPNRAALRDNFIRGANYVLEQVEMLLNSQRFVDDPSQELFELIKQLKK